MQSYRSSTGAFVFAVTLFASCVASAAVHTWRVDEIYSNASGTVQFIEMTTSTNGETFFLDTGAKLLSKDNASVVLNTFNFPNNLSGSTANKTVLIGTANLTALAGVTPDYILPASFLLFSGGKLEFKATTFPVIDTDTFPALPGGDQSYNPNTAALSSNTPKNFGGVQGHLVPEPSTVAMLACGLTCLGSIGVRRRFRRTRAVGA